jgi:hypothetical protein
MAVAAEERYVGVVWFTWPRGLEDACAALFDSPDRSFNSQGHAMGLVYPDYDAARRVEGDLLPVRPTPVHGRWDPEQLAERRALGKGDLSLSATIIGGRGTSVVPAVQHFLKLGGMPPVAIPAPSERQIYPATAAAGWLDSAIREGDLYRHAVPGDFRPQPAADAAVFQEWLAGQVADPATARRLREAAQAAIARVQPRRYDTSGVSHVRHPVASLVFGHVAENAERATEEGRAMLARFEADGLMRYRPKPGGPNYGKTHFTPDASGLTAHAVAGVLERAVVSGDPALLAESLRVLRAMDKFKGGVPRGAQTWEVPLHTPDVLAAAHMVRAYTLGYQLTGDEAMLESARYWAWTGVPFIYLRDGPDVEPYAGIAVFGATKWTAPNWMGLPVQWCALVYADALYALALHDPDGPWKGLALGIMLSGVRQTVPIAVKGGGDVKHQGLLPDSFQLRGRVRLPPFINPGTLQATVGALLTDPELCSFHSLRTAGVGSPMLLHVPGRPMGLKEEPGRAAFNVWAWPTGPYYVLVGGLRGRPRVKVDGAEVELKAPHQYLEGAGRLVLQLKGNQRVEIMARPPE